jgi:hypothetical protein
VVVEDETSVATGRTMQEIAAGTGKRAVRKRASGKRAASDRSTNEQ